MCSSVQKRGISLRNKEEPAIRGYCLSLCMEIFEEQAIKSALSKPKIWKRFVDDTFIILDQDRVDVYLQHLNSQQPSIRFTMEFGNNSKIAFLDTSVS